MHNQANCCPCLCVAMFGGTCLDASTLWRASVPKLPGRLPYVTVRIYPGCIPETLHSCSQNKHLGAYLGVGTCRISQKHTHTHKKYKGATCTSHEKNVPNRPLNPTPLLIPTATLKPCLASVRSSILHCLYL